MSETAPVAAAIARICRDLDLPEGGAYTQDWAYELSGEYRTEAHFYRYVSAYRSPAYGEPERRVLVELMLDVANDLLQEDRSVGAEAWSAIEEVVRENSSIHRDQVEYWALLGTSLEDAFALTPLAREWLHRDRLR